MMNEELTKWLAGLGVGGVLAAFIFWFYRRDIKSYTELWKEASGMLAALIRESTTAHVANTASNHEMIGLLKALHRRLDTTSELSATSGRGRNRTDERTRADD